MVKVNEILNPIAELDEPDSGRVVLPEEAYKDKLDYRFFCPDHDCKDSERILLPARSKLGVFFFKHKSGFTHDIHPQTLLHKLAVKWFEGIEEYEIPKTKKLSEFNLKLDKNKTELEFRKFERIIPDVKLTTVNGFTFAIEIVVTSDITPHKAKLIDNFGLPTLRVDLSEFYQENKELCRTNYEFVVRHRESLLTNIDLKTWVIPPKKSILDDISTNKKGCSIFFLMFAIIVLLVITNQILSVFS